MNDSLAKVTCGPLGSRRFPVRSGVSKTSGRLTTWVAMRRFGMAYMSEGVAAPPAAGVGAPHSHELSDQHGIGLVVTEVMVVGGSRVVVQRDEVALGIQPSAQLECIRRALGIPGRLLVPHPLHSNRPADLFGQKCRLEARVIGGRAAVALGSLHPDDAHLIAWHLKKLGDAVPQAIRFHVIGIDRHLPVRRIGRGMGRTDGRVALERDIVFGFDDLRRARQRRVGVPHHVRARRSTWASRCACT